MCVKLRVTYNDTFENHHTSVPEKDEKGIYRNWAGNSVSLRREGSGHMQSVLLPPRKSRIKWWKKPWGLQVTQALCLALSRVPHHSGNGGKNHFSSPILMRWAKSSLGGAQSLCFYKFQVILMGPALLSVGEFGFTRQQILMLRPSQVQSIECMYGGLRSR